MKSKEITILAYKPMKFVITGGLAFLAEYISFMAMVYVFSINLIISNALSFSLGLVTSFLLNKNWVFNNKEKSKRQLILYLALAIFNLLFSTFIISTLGKVVEPAIVKIVMVIVIAIWNYIIFSKVIFNKSIKKVIIEK